MQPRADPAPMVFLEDYVDTIESLPLELQRNFTLLRQLDAQTQDLLVILEAHTTAVLRAANSGSAQSSPRPDLAASMDNLPSGAATPMRFPSASFAAALLPPMPLTHTAFDPAPKKTSIMDDVPDASADLSSSPSSSSASSSASSSTSSSASTSSANSSSASAISQTANQDSPYRDAVSKEQLASSIDALGIPSSTTVGATRDATLMRLKDSFLRCLDASKEKVALATRTYELVDRHIRRLDDDLSQFEEELLANGYISAGGNLYLINRENDDPQKQINPMALQPRSVASPSRKTYGQHTGPGSGNPGANSGRGHHARGSAGEEGMDDGDDETYDAVVDDDDDEDGEDETEMVHEDESAPADQDEMMDEDDGPLSPKPTASSKAVHKSNPKKRKKTDKAAEPPAKIQNTGSGQAASSNLSSAAVAAATAAAAAAAAATNASSGSHAVPANGGASSQATASNSSAIAAAASDVGKQKQIKKVEATNKTGQVNKKGASAIKPEAELAIDPHEPVYCYCRQVSYGDMVACDNPKCKYEWFHYECAGLKAPPKGTWFCRECAAKRKKEGRGR